MRDEQLFMKEEFVRSFHRILQSLRIHREDNQLLTESVGIFFRMLGRLGKKESSVTIQFERGKLFFQEERLIYRRETANIFDNLMKYFEKRGIRGIRFRTTIEDTRELLVFAAALNQAEQKKDPQEWLNREVQEEGFAWVEILKQERKAAEQIRRQRGEQALRAYGYALDSVRDIARKLSDGNEVGIAKTLRVTQNMVDMMSEDEQLFLALSTIRTYDDYTYRHSLNVGILSICVGKRIGLSRKSLERLGLCGFLHDLGKVMVPKHILNKTDKLSPEEFEEMKKHVLNSVRQILRIHCSSDRKSKLLLPPFEHHLRYDLSGYPETDRKEPVSLFGRILAIADVYDAITSPRVYRRSVMSPDQALGMMFRDVGKHFDPILFKVFVNMIGIYPIGTLLKLDTGEYALVATTEDSADKTRPKVVLLNAEETGGFRKGQIADLSAKDKKTGKYIRNIVRKLNPADHDIQPAAFLF